MKRNDYALITLNNGGYALKAPDGTDVDLKKHNIDLTGYKLDSRNCAETRDGTRIYRFIAPHGKYYALTVYLNGELNGESHSKRGKIKPWHHRVFFFEREDEYNTVLEARLRTRRKIQK